MHKRHVLAFYVLDGAHPVVYEYCLIEARLRQDLFAGNTTRNRAPYSGVTSDRHHLETTINRRNNLLFIRYGTEKIRHGALQELGLQSVAGIVSHQELGAAQDVGIRGVFGKEEAVQHASNGTGGRELCFWVIIKIE